MEFKIEKRGVSNADKYAKEELEVVYKFSVKAHKEFGAFLKGVVLFGSAARKTVTVPEGEGIEAKVGSGKGDIDVLVIVDDVSVLLTKELVQTYRVIMERIIRDVSEKLHVITLRFTSFWEYVRAGDPVAVNVLRDGVPIIDTGFFEPLQLLLRQGRIRPTAESVWAYFNKAPLSLRSSQWHLLQGLVDLYWAVIDATHAVLMKMNEVPPSPERAAALLKEKLVKPGLLEPRHAKTVDNFYHLMKGITHGDIQRVSGEHFDHYFKEAERFVREMENFLKK